ASYWEPRQPSHKQRCGCVPGTGRRCCWSRAHLSDSPWFVRTCSPAEQRPLRSFLQISMRSHGTKRFLDLSKSDFPDSIPCCWLLAACSTPSRARAQLSCHCRNGIPTSSARRHCSPCSLTTSNSGDQDASRPSPPLPVIEDADQTTSTAQRKGLSAYSFRDCGAGCIQQVCALSPLSRDQSIHQ